MFDYNEKGSSDKPFVKFSTNGKLEIGGNSLPENIFDVYTPILNWITGYVENAPVQTTIDMYFEYLNTASSRSVMQIVEKLNRLRDKQKGLFVRWHYMPGDLDMKDFGEELLEDAHCCFEIISDEQLTDIVTNNMEDT